MDSKQIIKRAAIIGSIIITVIVLSVACNVLRSEPKNPTLSNPDAVFATYNGFEITYEQLYTKMVAQDGLMHLLNMIDGMLLTDLMDAVTTDAINDEFNLLMYGTKDLDAIDMMSEFDKEKAVQNYRDVVVVAGFDPDDVASVETFVRLNVAKRNLTIDTINEAAPDHADFVSEEKVIAFYNANYRGDIVALPLRFLSRAEFDAVMNRFNLVPNYNGSFGLYQSLIPIEDVASDGFNESNTAMLTNAEVLQKFIDVYNYLYPFRTPIDNMADVQTIIDMDLEHLQFNFNDLQESSLTRQVATYLFDDLLAASRPYSVTSKTIGDYRFLYYVLDHQLLPSYEDLDQARKDELRLEYITTLANEQKIRSTMAAYRDSLGFVIHDSFIAMQYDRQSNLDIFKADKSESIIATVNDQTITVDAFFDYMATRVGALYSIETAREQYLLLSDYFTNVYGSNRDLWANNSELMREHRNNIRELKSAFNSGMYAWYGFSPEMMSWEEFLMLAFGFKGEDDYLRYMVLQRLRNDFIFDSIDFDLALPYVQEQYDNYFNLKVEQILIFVDMEGNFTPDNFEDYLENMGLIDAWRFDTLKANLEALLIEALDTQSMRDIVTEYNNALRGEDESDPDYSKWAQFKNAGLLLKYENLSAEQSLNFNNTRNFVEPFVVGLIELYADYQLPENRSEASLLSRRLITSQFGVHMVRAQKGEQFDRPGDIITEAEAKLFAEAMLEAIFEVGSAEELEAAVRELLGDSLYDRIKAYYLVSYERFQTNAYMNMVMIEKMLAGQLRFETNNAAQLKMIDTVYDIFFRRTFPPLFGE